MERVVLISLADSKVVYGCVPDCEVAALDVEDDLVTLLMLLRVDAVVGCGFTYYLEDERTWVRKRSFRDEIGAVWFWWEE